MKKLSITMLYTLIVLLFISSIGYAEPTSRDTVTKYYSISPTAFVPEHHVLMYLRTPGHLQAASTNARFFASVYLPDSARVIEFKAWVRDSFPTNNITVRLYRGEINTQYVWPMAEASSVAGVGDQELTDSEINYSIIDNTLYAYSAEVHLRAPDFRHALYGMRITYEIIQESPTVNETSEETRSEATGIIYPSPFSNYASINYQMMKKGKVSIEIYDEVGRLVRTLADNTMAQGSYTAQWDGKDTNGRKVTAGSYFCVVKTNGSSTTKVVYIK